MVDIANALTAIMKEKQCSPVCAFILLAEGKEESDGIRILQSQSETEYGRGLCNKSNFQSN